MAPRPESTRPESIRAETKVAFYKAVKFWLVFVLAVLAAALLWRTFGESQAAPRAEEDAAVPAAPVESTIDRWLARLRVRTEAREALYRIESAR